MSALARSQRREGANGTGGAVANGAGRAVVGLDFDNTLVCYDRLFHRLAAERSLLSEAVAPFKRSIRDHLRAAGREDAWTELQAVAYGDRIAEAEPFPGAREFVRACTRRGIEVFVISHKTRVPYAGGDVDLRAAARRWLVEKGFLDATGALGPDHVYFGSTREEKIACIQRLGCTHFVDDLAEFLAEPSLPRDLVRILFEPGATERAATTANVGADASASAGADAGGGAGGDAAIDAAAGAGVALAGALSEPWVRARSWDEVASIVLGGLP